MLPGGACADLRIYILLITMMGSGLMSGRLLVTTDSRLLEGDEAVC